MIAPAIAGLALYTMVRIEPRYICVFLVILLLSLFAGVRLPDSAASQRLFIALVSIIFLFNIYSYSLIKCAFFPTLKEMIKGEDKTINIHRENYLVSQELKRIGIRPGDPVACIGDSFRAYWARLARLRIVTELPPVVYDNNADFWQQDASLQAKIIAVMRSTGVKAIIASPCRDFSHFWQRIIGTDYAYIICEKPNS